MSEAYIVNCKRSPVGKYGGIFKNISATRLAAQVVKDLLDPYPQLKDEIQEVVMGNVLSAGLGQNPARIVGFMAGLHQRIPALTINKVCGSSLKSVVLAAQSIMLEGADCLVAGGMENMSRAPFLVDDYRFGSAMGHKKLTDSMVHDGLHCALIDAHMGITAENIARKFRILREEQDAYALMSHQRAIHAQDTHKFDEEITDIALTDVGVGKRIIHDEQPRRDTSIEKLRQLKPVFKQKGTVTAGNASAINDGAAAIIVCSKKFIKKHRLTPLVAIRNFSAVGLDPHYMGLGGYYGAKECLKKARVPIEEVDLWEINEAFASQMLAVLKLLNLDSQKVNINGGAIALGHPIGASGARILTTLIHELMKRKLRFGVAALCIGGGQGIAMLVENVLKY